MVNKRISVSYLIVFVILIAAIILGLYIWDTITKVEPISSDELRTKIEETYSGKVKSMIITGNNEYEVEMESKAAIYAMKLDATTGKVNTMEKVSAAPIESKDIVVEEEPLTGKQITPTLISESKAIEIAQSRLSGELEDVSFEKTNEGGYFLVEIDGDDDQDAVIQVHAISGKILSVTLDD